MLDVNLLRKDLNAVIARLEARKSPQPYLDVADFQRLEAERKTIQTRTEELQARRNALSKQIGQLKSRGESTDAVMAEVAQCKVELDQSAARLELARLHRALAQFMLDVQTQEHGYTECYTPYIVNDATLRGTGQLPKFEGDLFAVRKGGQEGLGAEDQQALYLIPTSEVTLTNFVRDEVVTEAQLPLKLTAHTPC